MAAAGCVFIGGGGGSPPAWSTRSWRASRAALTSARQGKAGLLALECLSQLVSAVHGAVAAGGGGGGGGGGSGLVRAWWDEHNVDGGSSASMREAADRRR